MKYKIAYSLATDKGKCRQINQDNFFCDHTYLSGPMDSFQKSGFLSTPSLVSVFDGLGGEEKGEVAAFIAAKYASEVEINKNPEQELLSFCQEANQKICDYIEHNDVFSMGSTAALIAFTKKQITVCNVGDSKIFRFSEDHLEQLSVDHLEAAMYGRKPGLSQNLGLSPKEVLLTPSIFSFDYHCNDTYLICSDGLTDMVEKKDIKQVLSDAKIEECAKELCSIAIENGGLDNVTVIVCKVGK